MLSSETDTLLVLQPGLCLPAREDDEQTHGLVPAGGDLQEGQPRAREHQPRPSACQALQAQTLVKHQAWI